MPKKRKRIPNPLFEKWLEELRDEAQAEKNKPRYYSYCKALKSLKTFPFEIDIKKCADLPCFGPYIIRKLKEKMHAYNRDTMMDDDNWSEPDESPRPSLATDASRKRKKKTTSQIIAIQQLGSAVFQSVPSSTSSGSSEVDDPLPGEHYPRTSEADDSSDFHLNNYILDVPESVSSTADGSVLSEETTYAQSSNDYFEQLIFPPESFEICLLVDSAEAQSRSKYASKLIPETIRELSSFQTNFTVRHLDLGDFVWVARHKESGKELVLPYIVERKRMDDLVESFNDGRYVEQKFRLRKCGLPNVIYMVEKFGRDDSLFGVSSIDLRQRIVNTQVVDNFFLKTTNDHKHSMLYLSKLSNLLIDMFKDKTLYNCRRSDLPSNFDTTSDMVPLLTYEEFSHHSKKNNNLRIQDVFKKQLLKLKGLSVQQASIIVGKYPTVRSLRESLRSCSQPESVISNLTRENMQPIGSHLSKVICQLYTERMLSY